MKAAPLLAILLACCCRVYGQSEAMADVQPNIVPNASFEQFAAPPIGWFYKGEHFTRVVKYWSSPTAASPDVFGPKVRVPKAWSEKGFGDQLAQEGNCLTGITIFGCADGKPHCREYMQVELMEPLVIGQNYAVSFWAAHLPRSARVNNLGIYFSETEVKSQTDALLRAVPQVNSEAVIEAQTGEWIQIEGQFTASTAANYLIVGNFFPDEETSVQGLANAEYQYAYYYIDAVEVRKSEPILPVPLAEDDLSKVRLEVGKVVALRNIFFETDKAELLPRSFVELNKLLLRLQENPNMVIQIIGHTDGVGTEVYNLSLSMRRAKAVVNYLREKGVEPERLIYKGLGKQQPIATNETEAGRQLNRRVEFIVLQK